jgi:hypothetical protein
LTQKQQFWSIAVTAGLRLLMQTKTIGGSAQTEAKALTVTPNRPAGPSVVTTVTGVTAPNIAVKKGGAVSV